MCGPLAARRRAAASRAAASRAAALVVALVATALGACAIDTRQAGVAPPLEPNGPGPGGPGQPDAGCDGPSCVVANPEQPLEPECLAGCPGDNPCRTYSNAPASAATDRCGCPFTWTPAALEGAACRCNAITCLLLPGAVCSVAGTCDSGSCVATAGGNSVCCAQPCAASEVCAPDGSGCVPAEPCSGAERRCSGALHQSCVDGVWQTLSECALGCSPALDGCLRSAGQACEADADCGEGTCLAAAAGGRVCCTGACNSSCQRCSALGTECVNVEDDEGCGAIECPTDPCRAYDPATVVTNRCRDGQCATAGEACSAFEPQRAGLACSPTALCDGSGSCNLPKRELLAECGTNEQCATGNCVATAAGPSVCCSEACGASEVCGPTGACAPAPVCVAGTFQCSGSNFQQCVGGQWVTELACGALGCSLGRGGCFAGAGDACESSADCGEGTCQRGVGGGSVCCTAACGGPCRLCGLSGLACSNVEQDVRCGTVACSTFDAECVTTATNFVNACNGSGQCRTSADCGFRSSNTRCGEGGLCNGQGVCQGPSVECGNQTCSGGDACCSLLDFATGERTVGCGDGEVCNLPGAGAGPSFRIFCDQNADCVGSEVCCMVGNNVNSGEISCRAVCTAEAVGAELGAPPEMLVVGQLCASQAGPLVLPCPGGQTCSPAVSTLPPEYAACR